jgi:hypothetical protein
MTVSKRYLLPNAPISKRVPVADAGKDDARRLKYWHPALDF